MAQDAVGVRVTPGQAQWIVDRMIAERRISAAEVRAMLSGMSQEIADIERRLADLRAISGIAPVAAPTARKAVAPSKTRKRRAGGTKGHPRGVAGTLAVLLRSIPEAEQAPIAAIRAEKGIKAAIKAAKAAMKK